jgi:hypothetical protein
MVRVSVQERESAFVSGEKRQEEETKKHEDARRKEGIVGEIVVERPSELWVVFSGV